MSGHEQGLVLDFRILIGVRYDDDAKVFVSYSPAFELYSQGQTETRAMEAMKDAINGYIAVALKKHVLADVLNDVLPKTARLLRRQEGKGYNSPVVPGGGEVANCPCRVFTTPLSLYLFRVRRALQQTYGPRF